MTVCLDKIGTVVLYERSNDLLALDWADLLVDKTAVIGNSELEDVTFNEL